MTSDIIKMPTILWSSWKEKRQSSFCHCVPPSSLDLNPAEYSVWSILQKKVFKTCITDLDDLKHRIRIKWAKLDHAIIAAAVCQWRRRLSAFSINSHGNRTFAYFTDSYHMPTCRSKLLLIIIGNE